jgi:hypothetical protein
MNQILLIPNITWQKNIDQDSYVVAISNIITNLNKIRGDLWWHSPLPQYSKLLELPNVTQYFIDIPSYPNLMRAHFNVYDWKRIIDWKNKDFDLIYSHLPEWTSNVINLLENSTNIKGIPIIGYTHWTEIKEITNYDKTLLFNNINGLLEMKLCGINTKYQKTLIIENVKEIYSVETIRKLEKILKVIYLGITDEDVIDKINTSPEKIIVFNHRPQTYKDFPFFMRVMDLLWEKRKDFIVWIPLLENSNREYVDVTTYTNKKDYYTHLKRCYLGFAPKQKYGGWSISVTDGMMNGVPYVFYEGDYYKEMINEGIFFKTEEESLKNIETILDDINLRNSLSEKALKHCKDTLVWSKLILPISDMIDLGLKESKCVGNSIRIKEILEIIKNGGEITKNELLKSLGWGVGINWSPYRKFLKENKNIEIKIEKVRNINFFKEDSYNNIIEKYSWIGN